MIIVDPKDEPLYRPNVGIVLVNNQNSIFVGRRIGGEADAWQMPQGGINEDESEEVTLYREVMEEIGLTKDQVKIIQKSQNILYYQLPARSRRNFWHGKYIGQKQRWFLVKLECHDSKININTEFPEFCEWKWMSPSDVARAAVSFKKDIYYSVLTEFNLIAPQG